MTGHPRGNAKSFYHENYQIISEDDDYQTNERLESDFFDDGLEVHHERFAGTNDALVVEDNNLRKNKDIHDKPLRSRKQSRQYVTTLKRHLLTYRAKKAKLQAGIEPTIVGLLPFQFATTFNSWNNVLTNVDTTKTVCRNKD